MHGIAKRGRQRRCYGRWASAVASGFVLAGVIVGIAAQAANASAGEWSSAGSMASPRVIHQATLLADGRVLVTGGLGATGALDSAELYDPSSNTWGAAADMDTSRSRHVAIRLADGRVLIAGGRDQAGGSLRSVEIYDPAGNAWSQARHMATPRDNFTAVRLDDGRVLVAGGTDTLAAPFVSNDAEIYDPATDRWEETGHMRNARFGQSMTLLSDGRVLVAGGNLPGGDGAQTRTAEIYDPATGGWTLTGSMNVPRSFFSATRLADGRVLVAGGLTVPKSTRTATAEVYDPATGRWSPTGSMAVARAGFGFARESLLLTNGNVLVAGDAQGDASASVEAYDPISGTWSSLATMSVDRKDFAAVELADGRVLIAGGVTHDRIVLANAEYYTP